MQTSNQTHLPNVYATANPVISANTVLEVAKIIIILDQIFPNFSEILPSVYLFFCLRVKLGIYPRANEPIKVNDKPKQKQSEIIFAY